ncbi:uncharacterized protein DSM5745_05368 [Aspergillus mulundensis]|uniref:Uncharacterized protein n=1 Tax=Aspergillus mulundensis TaxID=1810919 RepID=A0A3D8S6W5_9EURO|nr:hypothetical protein DSM5745_05368 [Aspergillus mulundensis]RDW81811.1 hypothetical protein DSM5745_05368 [Aspergillus mulundensis]
MPPSRPLLHSRRLLPQNKSKSRGFVSGPTNIGYVRLIKRPWSRALIPHILFAGTALYIWQSIFLAHNDNSNVKSRKSSEKRPTQEKTVRGPSRPVFIPTGWARLQEGKLYAASDPEWKEFAKISKDDGKLRALKDELISVALNEASRSISLSRMLGAPFTIEGQWLQPQFPSRAKAAYFQSGLLFTDTAVAWVSKPVSTVRASYVALAALDAYSVLWGRFHGQFSAKSSVADRALGLSDYPRTILPSDFKTLDKLGDASRPEPPNRPNRDDGTQLQSSFLLSTLRWLPLPKFSPGSDFHAASLAFKAKINQCLEMNSRAHRQGTFSIRGPVGLRGSLGFCRVEVDAEYDPVASEWVSVTMHLKDVFFFQQQPLGGK